MRCQCCNKRLTLTEESIKCKCGNVYCAKHRHFEDHFCQFNFQLQDRKNLEDKLLSGKTSSNKLEQI